VHKLGLENFGQWRRHVFVKGGLLNYTYIKKIVIRTRDVEDNTKIISKGVLRYALKYLKCGSPIDSF